jgi:DtxR family Mn-dependent transcriptional regulator
VRITISKENYLKTISEAASEGETVKAVTLTRWLHVSAPAVTMAIKRLKRDGLIEVGEEGQIALTGPGREIASRLLNRHHLIERMLTEVFGLEWYKVHDEAEQLEHAVSTDFEQKLVEKLGHGGVCPHGNIVGLDSPAARRERGLKPLDEARPGEDIAVASVFERDRNLLEFLDSSGIRPGTRLQVLESGADIDLRLDGRQARIARGVAAKVWVRCLPSAPQ